MTASEPTDDADRARCASCSTELDPTARFCHACGVAVGTPTSTPTSTPTPTPEPEPAGTSRTEGTHAATDPGPDLAADLARAQDRDASSAREQHTQVLTTTPPAGMDRPTPDGPSRPAPTGGAVACAACGASNAPDREICGACGADVATGETGLSVAPLPARPGAVPSSGRSEGPSTRRWWIPVLAVLAVVGLVVGALAVLELGPFAPSADIPPVDFAAEGYAGDPETLALTDVATLTMRDPDGQRTFTPERMVDGDPTSSWHGDTSALPDGTDEKVDLFLERPSWVTGVVLSNGDHLDADAYADAARIQRVELVFDGDVRVAATLLDQGLAPQIVELTEPLLTTAVRIEVVERFDGLESEDVALSRVELLGHTAEGEDVAIAQERADLRPAAGAVQLPPS